jgi:hypothetical protein
MDLMSLLLLTIRVFIDEEDEEQVTVEGTNQRWI